MHRPHDELEPIAAVTGEGQEALHLARPRRLCAPHSTFRPCVASASAARSSASGLRTSSPTACSSGRPRRGSATGTRVNEGAKLYGNALVFIVIAGFFFLMMRFGCGAHVIGHGHRERERKAPVRCRTVIAPDALCAGWAWHQLGDIGGTMEKCITSATPAIATHST